MHTELNKWGNSLALRIPSALAKKLGMKPGSLADLRVENGALVVAPVVKPLLADMLQSMERCNMPEKEISTGYEAGHEASEW